MGALAVVIGLGSMAASPAAAGDLGTRLSDKRAQLQHDRTAQASLISTLQGYDSRVAELTRQVETLRSREATVQRNLELNRERLRNARVVLDETERRLHHSLKVLRRRLVAIYTAGVPDIAEVILTSQGFQDLISRSTYLDAIEHKDGAIARRTRILRNQSRRAVQRISAARTALEAERNRLAAADRQLQSRRDALVAERARQQSVLVKLRSNGRRLQREISSIQSRIERQNAASATTTGLLQPAPVAVPLGPIPPGQAISPFPASSPITWGRTDQGVDGTTTPGSPLLAMGDGTVDVEHDPGGFGADYPVIHTSFGSFYYGHCVPIVGDGTQVSIGQPIATAHYGTWGNSTTPGGFEIGAWPPGGMTAGAAIRSWLISLPRR